MILNKGIIGVGKDMFGMMTIYVIQVNLTREISMRGIGTRTESSSIKVPSSSRESRHNDNSRTHVVVRVAVNAKLYSS